jgi:hypothetical protein
MMIFALFSLSGREYIQLADGDQQAKVRSGEAEAMPYKT